MQSENVTCANFAENKGMRQEGVSIEKRQGGQGKKKSELGGQGRVRFSKTTFCTRRRIEPTSPPAIVQSSEVHRA